jgi:anti-sigma factor RsiW
MTMTDPGERAEEAALWRRWQLDSGRGDGAAGIDPLLLAAYAEGRLDEARAEPVEDWLAARPEVLADIVAARAATAAALPAAPEAVIARAAALVEPPDPKIVRFPASAVARHRSWRTAFAWSSIAASLLATSLIGFALGNDAYVSFIGQANAGESVARDLFDPPSMIFIEDEEPST